MKYAAFILGWLLLFTACQEAGRWDLLDVNMDSLNRSAVPDPTPGITPSPITDQLVGWYKFDENAGSFITDSSGNGYNGTFKKRNVNIASAPGNLVNGNLSDYWSGELGLNWFIIDLEAVETVGSIVLCHGAYNDIMTGEYNTEDFTVLGSLDGIHYTTIYSETGNSAKSTTVNGIDTNYRYIKVNITSPNQAMDTVARIVEIEIKRPDGTNIALNKPILVSNDQAADGIRESGVFDRALRFNGINELVDLGSQIRTDCTGAPAVSISIWVKFDAHAAGWDTLFYIPGRTKVDNSTAPLIKLSPAADQAEITIEGQNNTWGNLVFTGYGTASSWHHLVGIIDFSSGAFQIYLDGNLVEEANAALGNSAVILGTFDPYHSDVIGAGYDTSGSTEYFKGLMDDLRIYKKALTGSEIDNIYAGYGN